VGPTFLSVITVAPAPPSVPPTFLSVIRQPLWPPLRGGRRGLRAPPRELWGRPPEINIKVGADLQVRGADILVGVPPTPKGAALRKLSAASDVPVRGTDILVGDSNIERRRMLPSDATVF